MRKIIYLVLVIFTTSNIIYSFIYNKETDNIFMFEVDIWIYRLFNAILTLGIIYEYFKKRKAKNNSN